MNFISKYIFKTQFDNAHTPLVGLMLTFRHKKKNLLYAFVTNFGLLPQQSWELSFYSSWKSHSGINWQIKIYIWSWTPLPHWVKGSWLQKSTTSSTPVKSIATAQLQSKQFPPAQNPDKITCSYPVKMSKSFGDAQRTILVSTENMLAHPHSHYYLSSLDKSILKSF